MKKCLGVLCLLMLAGLIPVRGQDPAAPAFTVTRMVACTGVENREPAGEAQTFPATTGKVYCYLEAGQIKADTAIQMVWYLGDKEMARVDLSLKAGSRWRTNSSKTIAGRTGDWKVDLLDGAGTVVHSVAFKVE